MELKIDSMINRTTALENNPRFVAEKRSGSYLPKGYITDFTELVDSGEIFNPTTGRLITNEEGDFLLHITAYKSGTYGKGGEIKVYKNQDVLQYIFETDEENRLMMNTELIVHLQKGDEVKLYNDNDESILVRRVYPLTFTGYKI